MRRPAGFTYHRVEKITKEMRLEQRAVAEAFVAAAWLPALENEGEWEEDLVGCAPEFSTWLYRKSRGLRRRSRLLGLSTQNTKRFLAPARKLFEQANPKLIRQGIWLPEGFRGFLLQSDDGGRLGVPKAANPPSTDPIDSSRFQLPDSGKIVHSGEDFSYDPPSTIEEERIRNFSFCAPSGIVTNVEFSGFSPVLNEPLPVYEARDSTVPRYFYPPPPSLNAHVPGRTVVFNGRVFKRNWETRHE